MTSFLTNASAWACAAALLLFFCFQIMTGTTTAATKMKSTARVIPTPLGACPGGLWVWSPLLGQDLSLHHTALIFVRQDVAMQHCIPRTCADRLHQVPPFLRCTAKLCSSQHPNASLLCNAARSAHSESYRNCGMRSHTFRIFTGVCMWETT